MVNFSVRRRLGIVGFAALSLSVVTGGAEGAQGGGPALAALGGWEIVVDGGATVAERYAAAELRRLLAVCGGAEPPVVERGVARRGQIYVGAGAAFRRSSLAFEIDSFGPEEYRLRIGRHRIAIVGGRPRGTLYGVYDFAERFLGVRFLTADHEYAPREAGLRLPVADVRYAPPFVFRWSYCYESLVRPEFGARLRMNVNMDERFGGGTRQPLIGHSLYRQVPVGEYGADHPEYFALVNGERRLDAFLGPQVNSTHPDVIGIVTRSVLDELEANPDTPVVVVSQNDNALYCEDEVCAAIDAREESHMGAHLTLVNAVAGEVGRRYPGVKVGTLAYQYTRKPPRYLRPGRTVQIQLGGFECDGLRPVDAVDSPRNTAFRRDLEGWRKLTDEVWLWHYNTNLRHVDLPYANLGAIGPALRYYRDQGVRGVFMQGNGRCAAGDWSDLRHYVTARLLWDPDLDADALIEEFIELHYAESAGPVRAYFNLLHETVRAKGAVATCWSRALDAGLDVAFARRAAGLLEEAKRLAQSEEARRRVEKLSIGVYKALIETGGSWRYLDGRLRLVFAASDAGRIPEYEALCAKYGMDRDSEFSSRGEYLAALRQNMAGIPAERFEGDTWRLTLLPEFGGAVAELYHKPSGRQLFDTYEGPGVNLPYGLMRTWFIRGWPMDAPLVFECATRGSKAVLVAPLGGIATLERVITLEGGVARFQDTLTHCSAEPRTYQARVAPDVACVGAPDAVGGYVLDGDWRRVPLAWDDMGAERSARLESAGGAFGFYSAGAGFGVGIRYARGPFGPPVIRWRVDERVVRLELTGIPMELRRGGRFVYEYAVEYWPAPPDRVAVRGG